MSLQEFNSTVENLCNFVDKNKNQFNATTIYGFVNNIKKLQNIHHNFLRQQQQAVSSKLNTLEQLMDMVRNNLIELKDNFEEKSKQQQSEIVDLKIKVHTLTNEVKNNMTKVVPKTTRSRSTKKKVPKKQEQNKQNITVTVSEKDL